MRQRHVYQTQEIAHLWAHQTQQSARNQQNNFYFDGPTIYSYGGHFPIASHVTGTRKRKAVLITTRGYGNTTSGHICKVRGSIPAGVQKFYVLHPELGCIHLSYGAMVDDIKTSQLWLADPPKRTRKLTIARRSWELCSAICDANMFAEFFGIRKRLRLPSSLESCRDESKLVFAAEVKAIAAREKCRLERARIEAQEREQERTRVRIENLPEWIGGAPFAFNRRYEYALGNLPEAYLRIDPSDPATVHTTQGATVPLSDVQNALPVILRGIENVIASGQAWHSNGQSIRVGHYTLDRIESDGTVVIGCHRFERVEVQRFAGVVDKLETDEESTQ